MDLDSKIINPRNVDLDSKICDLRSGDSDCNKRPNYGFPNGKKEFCFSHKLEGMINLNKRKRSRKCEDPVRSIKQRLE